MEPTIEQLMTAYADKYPQQVRDLAETFCAATTRLARPEGARPAVLSEGMRLSARKHGIDIDTLAAAVTDYSLIEARAEEAHRLRGGSS